MQEPAQSTAGPTHKDPFAPYGHPYGERPPGQDDGGLDIKDLLAILRRRRRVVLSTILLLTTLATLIGLQLTPKYTAKALVMIDPRKERVVNVEEVLQGLNPDAAIVETQINVIKSRAHIERVMDHLQLFADAEFNPRLRQDEHRVVVKFRGIWEEVLGWLPEPVLIAAGLAEEPVLDENGELPEWSAREAAIAAFDDNLKVTQEGRSYVIAISFTSIDPVKAARVANVVARLYVDAERNRKVEATKEASGWLAERLEALRSEVIRAEQAVEAYRAEAGLIDAGGRSLKEQELSDINRELAVARADLAEREAKLRLINELRRQGESLDSVADVIDSPVIVNLRQQEALLLRDEAELKTYYGEKHPKMQNLLNEKQNLQEKIQREVERIVRNLENDVRVTRARLASLERDLEALSGITEEQRQKLVRLRELEREAQASRQLYEAFLQRFKETREQADIVKSDARVVSEAAPPDEPSTPGAKLFAAAGFTISMMVSTLLALLLERLDRGLRSGRQIEAELQLAAIGLVPKLDRLKKGQRPHQYLIQKPLSAYAESIRAIFTSLQLSDVDRPPKVVLVTSSIPQEGKTTLAVSLATLAARSSQRTLLVDLDLRHPSIQRELSFTPQAGVVECVAGERTLEEVVCHHDETSIDYLPVKRQTPNPTGLLGSQRMRQLIEELREIYDFIVIDSAPLLGVTDAKMVARLVDKVLFVVRWEQTNAETARNALRQLQEVRASVAGAVLTLVDIKKHAYYGYGDVGQYYAKYQKYYVN